MDDLHMSHAVKMAWRSPQRKFLTGAVIVTRSGDLITGTSHVSSMRLSKVFSMHSELHALGRARHLDLRDAEIYVATIARKSGNLTLAKPCAVCAIALRSAGVRKAYYTMDNANSGVLDLEADLETLDLYQPVPAHGWDLEKI